MAKTRIALPTAVKLETPAPSASPTVTPAVTLPAAPERKADPNKVPWTPAVLRAFVTLAGDAGYVALADRPAYTARDGDAVEAHQMLVILRSPAHFHRVFNAETGLERETKRRQYTAFKVNDIALFYQNGAKIVEMINAHPMGK